jgi:hypothetical protein
MWPCSRYEATRSRSLWSQCSSTKPVTRGHPGASSPSQYPMRAIGEPVATCGSVPSESAYLRFAGCMRPSWLMLGNGGDAFGGSWRPVKSQRTLLPLCGRHEMGTSGRAGPLIGLVVVLTATATGGPCGRGQGLFLRYRVRANRRCPHSGPPMGGVRLHDLPLPILAGKHSGHPPRSLTATGTREAPARPQPRRRHHLDVDLGVVGCRLDVIPAAGGAYRIGDMRARPPLQASVPIRTSSGRCEASSALARRRPCCASTIWSNTARVSSVAPAKCSPLPRLSLHVRQGGWVSAKVRAARSHVTSPQVADSETNDLGRALVISTVWDVSAPSSGPPYLVSPCRYRGPRPRRGVWG